MTQTATILIDIQNDYFPTYAGAKMPLPNMEDAAGNAARVLQNARAKDELIVHIRHIAPLSDAPFFAKDSAGSEIHSSVAPRSGETVIVKQKPNSFLGTNLQEVLNHAGVSDLIICGAMSQMCVDATVRAASDLGFSVTVAEDACAAANISFAGQEVGSKQVHASIMAPLAAAYAKVVKTSDCQ